ncbi:TIR domain-containing protein [Opitutus sp. GAS368]|uniref:TIR domain-containing protein n=1 Tax=Opitutus sp. GAS368 TaxID=1882749 RepID=UPI00087C2576|nr:TIR domain-containing protein [Opitutus sp. GAS368]SDS37825.1 TolB amino-terminal domain-containing protein [Opitutus sp. GAS368]
MPEPLPKAVFLSYAREDTDAARQIAEALRAAGIEVWFDQSELRGGDLWDQKIRRQIRECALFIPIISAQTQARAEGYFRREWKMAVDRTHDMSESRSFLVPVLVDDTPESAADVPEQFLRAHCTRLPDGQTTPAFVGQVQRLLQPARSADAAAAKPAARAPRPAAAAAGKSAFPRRTVVLGAIAAAFVVGGYFWLNRPAVSVASPTVAPPPAPTPAATSDKSIAVLPFVDMSSGHDQEYMSDGLTEELLDLLAKTPTLLVTSRSSAFSFKGRNVDIPEIARRLHVAHVLEGSVRKSGNKLRITAQLIDARTDTHLWSETYDRDLTDIFAVQDEIATAVVTQLKLALLGAPAKTRKTDPRAYELFLRTSEIARQAKADRSQQMISLMQQALAIDPNYAAAWTRLAVAYANEGADGTGSVRTVDDDFRLAREAANKSLAIDPDYVWTYPALANIAMNYDGDVAAAARYLEHALALEPANAGLMLSAATLVQNLGRLDQAVALREYNIARDPLSPFAQLNLGITYLYAGRPDDAIAACRASLAISPGRVVAHYIIGLALLAKHDPQAALAEMQREPAEGWRDNGLPLVYHALGRKAESDAVLAAFIAKWEKGSAFNVAGILAYRGETDRAFEWLEKAVTYRDTGLSIIMVEPQLASLHSDPRWLPFLRKIGKAPEQLAAIKFDVKLPGK